MRVVTTNGIFDLLHLGHLYILEKAREQGDYLIVLINSDASALAQKKTPIFNQDERKKMLEAVRYVDEVRVFDELDPREALRQIKPYAHVKSKSGYKGLEKEVLDEYGGKLILVDDIPSFSSTSLMYEITRRVVKYTLQDDIEVFMR